MRSNFGFFAALATLSSTVAAEQCDVDTSVGKVQGLIDSQTPGVKQWLGVPYAEPPIQSLRFSPPIAKSKGGVIQAQKPPPSCQQYLSAKPDIFNQETPEFLPPGPYDEDCLYLNVIAPRLPHAHPLPVLVWIHGGMTTFGGINTPYERPQKWVQRSQQHIVVQVKASCADLALSYRLNIFGFPNAKGLDQNNLGVLDQRLALEWVRKNIGNFGGDPSRITLWGQSAGGATADAHQFAFASDPIFSSILSESGDVLNAMTASDPNKTSFSLVAQKLGCAATESPTDEVACMRKIDANVIEKFLLNYTDSGATPPLYFSAIADNKIAFLPQQYVAKGTAGDFANVPMLIGSNTNEGSSFVPFSKSGTGVTPALDEAVTLKVIQCGVATTCRYRQASGRTTFRYLYGGNFTNISPLPWLGAYHYAELPLIMGTDSDYRSASTPFETHLSHKMQDLWLTFAQDPIHGLPNKGWNPYSAGKAIVFGVNGTLVGSEPVAQLDAKCPPPS